MPDFTWPQQQKTLILVLKAGCRFCDESMPFYQRVIETGRNSNVKLVAVFPTSIEDSTAYLNKYGIANVEVKQAPLDILQIRATPTVILTNEVGEATDFWIGKLTRDKEEEVIDRLL